MLPDLGRLALLHAHEEEEPTGVLAEWKRRREAVRPQLVEGLPLELRQLVTDQLVAKHAGDGVALCAALEAWCRAHPIACTKSSLWEAAFKAAFGSLDPSKMEVWQFTNAFYVPRARRPRDGSPPYKQMFMLTCKALVQLDPSEARVYAHMTSWTDAQLDHYCFGNRMTYDEQTSAQKQLHELMFLKGASVVRYQDHEDLARAALAETLNVEYVRSKLTTPGIDVDYVLPSIPGFPGSPGSLLYRVVKQNKNFNPKGVAVVRLLLEHGADPNGVDVHGHRMTYGALHWAIRYTLHVFKSRGRQQVKLLLAAGADPTLGGATEKRPYGKTPRDLYEEMRHRPGPRADVANAMLPVLDEAIAAREAAAIAAA